MNGRRWRWGLIGLLTAVAVGLLGCGWRWWEVQRDREAMAEIEEEIENGRPGTAARDLAVLLGRRPDSDEAIYLLGVCESARGRTQAASEAWSRVAPDSAFAARAIFGLIDLEMERGRFAEAERIVENALRDPLVDSSSLPILLGPLYCNQGRLEETLRLLESRWDHLNESREGASEAAINLVRAHIDLPTNSVSTDVVRSILDHAAEMAVDDDRVWLGKANLAIRVGAYDEAAHWIEACLRKRPADIPVWRARLQWAMASGRLAEAMEAVKRLPVSAESPALVARLAAWLAAQRKDPVAERRALEQLIAIDPEDFAAFDRVAELLAHQGQSGPAIELKHRKHEIERLRGRYLQLHKRYQPWRDSAEMSVLAEQLGRRFEARAFAVVAAVAHPDDDNLQRRSANLGRSKPNIDGKGTTVADTLASAFDSAIGASNRTPPAPLSQVTVHEESRP
jgi:enediyne biosynthesis protein E4